eukprot:PhF_6_TR2311/c0_g1_i7/m.4075
MKTIIFERTPSFHLTAFILPSLTRQPLFPIPSPFVHSYDARVHVLATAKLSVHNLIRWLTKMSWLGVGSMKVKIIKDCRYHDVHSGANIKPITDSSMFIHHVTVDEYDKLMQRFRDDPLSSSFVVYSEGNVHHKIDMVGNDVK